MTKQAQPTRQNAGLFEELSEEEMQGAVTILDVQRVLFSHQESQPEAPLKPPADYLEQESEPEAPLFIHSEPTVQPETSWRHWMRFFMRRLQTNR